MSSPSRPTTRIKTRHGRTAASTRKRSSVSSHKSMSTRSCVRTPSASSAFPRRCRRADAMPAQPPNTSRQSVRRATAEHIKQLIFEGTLERGDRVPQNDIAVELNISVTPVREALIMLEQEGLVSFELHRGAFVNAFNAEMVRDQYELYGVIFGWAVRRTTERATRRQLEEFRRLATKIERSTSPKELFALVSEVTERLNDIGGTPTWRRFLDTLTRLVPGNFYQKIPGAAAAAKQWLPKIVDAMAAADAEEAVAHVHSMMQDHS